MSFEINKVHLSDNRWGMSLMPAKSVQLIISDPPYYKVKGDFDFIFKDFAQYLEFMEEQAIAYKRVLADNGSLFVYGHAKKIAYVQCIFDKYFNLENNICWQVPDRRTNKGIDGYRSFAPVTERILFYSNEMVSTNGEYVYPARDYLRSEIKRAVGYINYRVINDVFGTATNGGGMASAILSPHKSEPAFITEDQYKKLREYLNAFCTDPLSKPYEYLRKEYEDLRRPFDNMHKLTDVMTFSQEGHNAAKYNHETMKPEALTRALIQTCSRPGDLVLVPFAGSGTECAMSIKEGRNFIAFDNDIRWVEEANARCELTKQKQQLF